MFLIFSFYAFLDVMENESVKEKKMLKLSVKE